LSQADHSLHAPPTKAILAATTLVKRAAQACRDGLGPSLALGPACGPDSTRVSRIRQ
jgi:hypothetical protein